MTRLLWPSLPSIERRLFGGMDSSTAGITLDYRGMESDESIQIPTFIKYLITQRVKSAERSVGNEMLPGGIVAIPSSAVSGEHQPSIPIFVLLDSQDYRRGTWYAWMTSAEVDYAGWNDLVVPEEEGLDPVVGMVQAWNRFAIRIPKDASLAGNISPKLLTSIRLLADPHVSPESLATAAEPGRIALRSLGGDLWGVTGSPLGITDQRIPYRRMYKKLAKLLSVEACEQQRNPLISELWNSLQAFAQEAQIALTPIRWLPDAMGDQSSIRSVAWDEKIETAMLEAAEGAVEIRFRLKLSHSASVCLYEDDFLLQKETLSNADPEAAFVLTAGQGMALVISVDNRRPLIWRLNNA